MLASTTLTFEEFEALPDLEAGKRELIDSEVIELLPPKIPHVSVPFHNQSRGEYMEGAPLLAIEIISPSNRADLIERKISIYLASGRLPED